MLNTWRDALKNYPIQIWIQTDTIRAKEKQKLFIFNMKTVATPPYLNILLQVKDYMKLIFTTWLLTSLSSIIYISFFDYVFENIISWFEK